VKHRSRQLPTPHGPAYRLCSAEFHRADRQQWRPAFTFDAIEGFQRIIRLASAAAESRARRMLITDFRLSSRGRKPLLQLLFSVLQIVLINKLLCQLQKPGAVGVFIVSREFLRPVSVSGVFDFSAEVAFS
jgi:hypothetical protein